MSKIQNSLEQFLEDKTLDEQKEKPNYDKYRFECRIVDMKTDEIVVQASTAIPNEKRVGDSIMGLENIVEEAAENEFWSMFRVFRNRFQAEHEAKEETEMEKLDEIRND